MPAKIGLIRLTFMSVGGILGMSVFTLPATLHKAGMAGYLTWLLVTPPIICLSLMFARLSMLYPGAGGPYGYVRAIFGNKAGKITGYLYLLAMIVQQSAVLAFFGETVVTVTGTQHVVLACVLPVMLCGATNAIKLETTATLSTFINALKFAPILLLLFAHAQHLPLVTIPTVQTSDLQSISQCILESLPILLFAFSGFEFGTIASVDEIEKPEVTVPKAVAYSTILAGVVYFLMQCMVAVHGDTVATIQEPDEVLYRVAENTFGILFRKVLSVSKLIFAWYAVTFGIVFIGHMLYQMSKNKDLPLVFSKHKHTYKICITTSTVLPLLTLFAVTGQYYRGFTAYVAFIESCDVIFSVVFLLCTASYVYLRSVDVLGLGSALGATMFLYSAINYKSSLIALGAFTLLVATIYLAERVGHAINHNRQQ